MTRRVAAAASIVGLWLLAGCGPRSRGSGQASPSPSAAAAPAARTAGGSPAPVPPGPPTSPLKITVRGSRVGSHYIFVTQQKGNRKVYVLRADSESGEYFGSDTGISNFVNPHVTFFGAHGQRFVADAPRGTAVEKDKTIRMSGGVHARTADGKTLTSDTLLYADTTETAYGNGHVVLTSPSGDRLQGDRLVWSLRTGHIDVRGAG